jgi:hypothetical protein
MTEAEWLTCNDPRPILESVRDRASARKLRLFAVALYRYLSGSNGVVDVAERHADGTTSAMEMRDAGAEALWHSSNWYRQMGTGEVDAIRARYSAVIAPRSIEAAELIVEAAGDGGAAAACDLLRDIFGNPSRRVAVDAAWLSWRDGTIPKLAEAIYEDRAFDRLPILADALEDAGCTDADLLHHCRGPGPHIRGCWVVDLLLEKE